MKRTFNRILIGTVVSLILVVPATRGNAQGYFLTIEKGEFDILPSTIAWGGCDEGGSLYQARQAVDCSSFRVIGSRPTINLTAITGTTYTLREYEQPCPGRIVQTTGNLPFTSTSPTSIGFPRGYEPWKHGLLLNRRTANWQDNAIFVAHASYDGCNGNQQIDWIWRVRPRPSVARGPVADLPIRGARTDITLGDIVVTDQSGMGVNFEELTVDFDTVPANVLRNLRVYHTSIAPSNLLTNPIGTPTTSNKLTAASTLPIVQGSARLLFVCDVNTIPLVTSTRVEMSVAGVQFESRLSYRGAPARSRPWGSYRRSLVLTPETIQVDNGHFDRDALTRIRFGGNDTTRYVAGLPVFDATIRVDGAPTSLRFSDVCGPTFYRGPASLSENQLFQQPPTPFASVGPAHGVTTAGAFAIDVEQQGITIDPARPLANVTIAGTASYAPNAAPAIHWMWRVRPEPALSGSSNGLPDPYESPNPNAVLARLDVADASRSGVRLESLVVRFAERTAGALSRIADLRVYRDNGSTPGAWDPSDVLLSTSVGQPGTMNVVTLDRGPASLREVIQSSVPLLVVCTTSPTSLDARLTIRVDPAEIASPSLLHGAPSNWRNAPTFARTFDLRLAPPPSISVVSPSSGAICGGTSVTITGRDFFPNARVFFGTTPAESVVVQSRTSLVAVTPAETASGPVDVSVDTGITPVAVAPNAFTYLHETPIVATVSPIAGPYAGGTVVTIRGEHFCAASTVTFAGVRAATTSFVDDRTLVVTTPFLVSRSCRLDYAADVRVTNPDQRFGERIGGFTFQPVNVLRVAPQGRPYASIQAAIDAAQDGDAIAIDPGVGFPRTNYQEAINPKGKRVLITSSNPDRLVRLQAPSVAARVITVNRGEGRNTVIACLEAWGSGGGVLVDNASSPTVVHCEIHNHLITGDGGGVLVRRGSSPMLRDNKIHTNTARDGGGVAVLDANSAAELDNNEVFGNTANGNGGGLYLGANTAVTRVTGGRFVPGWTLGEIRENRASGRGGGIYCAYTPPTRYLTACRLIQNEAEGEGGGVFVAGGSSVRIAECVIENNNPDRLSANRYHLHGGGIACDATVTKGTQLWIVNNTIRGNRADGPCAMGGGIYVRSREDIIATVEIEGNRIVENISQVGAGIALDTKIIGKVRRNIIAGNRIDLLCNATPPCPTGKGMNCRWQPNALLPDVIAPGILEIDCEVILVHNTFYGNNGTATNATAGALHAKSGMFGDSWVDSNVFAQNLAPEIYREGAANFPVRHNTFHNTAPMSNPYCQPSCSLVNNILMDPAFVDASAGDFSLQANSPCIDRGNPAPSISVPPIVGLAPDCGALESGASTGPAGNGAVGTPFGGGPYAVLTVNGSGGGADHAVLVQDTAIRIDVGWPSRGNGGAPGGTVWLFLYVGAPTPAEALSLGASGTMCFAPFAPAPPIVVAAPTPWSLDIPRDLVQRLGSQRLTLQGVIWEDTFTPRVTNAVVVAIE